MFVSITDIDECAESPNFCEEALQDEIQQGLTPTITGDCVNVAGSAYCTCAVGFEPIDGVNNRCKSKQGRNRNCLRG